MRNGGNTLLGFLQVSVQAAHACLTRSCVDTWKGGKRKRKQGAYEVRRVVNEW